MTSPAEPFGSLVFHDRVMGESLSPRVYASLQETIRYGRPLDPALADAVAAAMKAWALKQGVSHYTHWFQPLSGFTAEKHDSFLVTAPDGGVLTEFSGRALTRGEPDASAFPSGGLRATFEARGYTAWDPSSYAFIKDNILCIPTAFCGYNGEALDQKTPLLRSIQTLDKQALRILRLFGDNEIQCVRPWVGAEQEYFLIPEALYRKRPDLIYTGRTLTGAKPPKVQKPENHYFGAMQPQVSAFMQELDRELWKLGILVKTEHKEVAPCQYELAPIHTTANIAADQNQLIMELLQTVAARHGLRCLLCEKPFAWVNGSGKHNNWSLITDTGVNLLSPGKSPWENARFLLFVCAVMEAVDNWQDLLRISTAGAGNDLRLGADEAPPAILSVFLGDELSAILDAVAKGTAYPGTQQTTIALGAQVLPPLPRDATDRNRTAPIAFTGNKFEFRMPGASQSIAEVNTYLNAAVAHTLSQYADRLEDADHFEAALQVLLRETIMTHSRILFSGNCYSEDWIQEARRRGLHDLPDTPEALSHLLDDENVKMLTELGVFSRQELRARRDIRLESYCISLCIAAETHLRMTRRQILPALTEYMSRIAPAAEFPCSYVLSLLARLSELAGQIDAQTTAMEEALAQCRNVPELQNRAFALRDGLLPKMAALRASCDTAETLLPEALWPFPDCGALLFD